MNAWHGQHVKMKTEGKTLIGRLCCKGVGANCFHQRRSEPRNGEEMDIDYQENGQQMTRRRDSPFLLQKWISLSFSVLMQSVNPHSFFQSNKSFRRFLAVPPILTYFDFSHPWTPLFPCWVSQWKPSYAVQRGYSRTLTWAGSETKLYIHTMGRSCHYDAVSGWIKKSHTSPGTLPPRKIGTMAGKLPKMGSWTSQAASSLYPIALQ